MAFTLRGSIMDDIAEFIRGLTARQEPQYQEIVHKASKRWTDTGMFSPNLARWIRQGAKCKGMKMPEELGAVLSMEQ
jgi:hypothetical protein